ncbi:MAG: Rieske 2Fe-2S domain-containing protein [Myxococcales bacterium]|nr:Rieske 2Fe-2S domain-containing protein [Myxococcales bacterium]
MFSLDRTFRFDTDISQAWTLPASWYLSDQMAQWEDQRIFSHHWQWVAHIDELREVGSFVTRQVAGEPLVILRDEDQQLRGFFNVCRHRAGRVARGCGKRQLLQCVYHGWTYRLDGSLHKTPEFQAPAGFSREAMALRPVEVAQWGPFVFARLSKEGGLSLEEWLDPIPAQTKHLPLEKMRFFKRVDYEIQCNWKVYVDNYLEGYHIPLAHPGLFREIDYKQYDVECFRYVSRQHAPVRPREDSLYVRHLAAGENPEALYYWAFPNLMFNFYPDNLQLNVILPLGKEKTLTIFLWYLLEPDRPGVEREFAASFAFSDQVQKEDIQICEEVQVGLRSRSYTQGRYVPERERGVHHFHGLLWESLKHKIISEE